MFFRYRFKGVVNSQFVLRGMLFKPNTKIDFCIYDKELDFVKQHCEVVEIIDRNPEKVVEEPLETVLEERTESKPKGVKNGKSNNKRQSKTNA